MADNINGEGRSEALPPKLDLRKTGLPQPAGGEGKNEKADLSKTIPLMDVPGLELPPPVPVHPGAAPGAAAGTEKKILSKKETSRIPLEAAIAGTPEAVSAGGEAAVPPSTVRLVKPSVIIGAGAAPAPTDQKRKTSRISLEAALAPDAKAAEATAAPKTIRLKRPTEVPTVRVSQPIPAVRPGDTSKIVSPLDKTARIEGEEIEEEVVEEGEDGSPTRRKTIRVKRPTERPTVAAGGVVAAEGAPVAVARAAAPVIEDEPSVAFPVFAVLTILLILVTIYVFAAQAYGPDLCLTKLSYGAPGMDLGWPGKIVPQGQ